MEYPLVVSHLRKSYKAGREVVHAVRDVSFKVRRGEIFGLLGPNGAGKTTTINMLTGILTPDSGTVKFFGMSECEETRNRINTATAYNNLNGVITVQQNLRVYAKMYNIRNANAVIDDLLQKFEINDLRNRRVYDLSSGQKTRVNLCKSLINSPDLIFLDEATAGLDPHIAHEVRKKIKELKTTVIFTSHIMYEVEELCNRVAFLSKGKILKIDTPEKIRGMIKENVIIVEFLSEPRNAERILQDLNVVGKSKNKVIIKLKGKEDLDKIVHKLVTSGFKIRDLHVKKPTLDEIFIRVAKGAL